MQVGRGRARGGQHRDRGPGGLGQAEGQEAGGPLVDAGRAAGAARSGPPRTPRRPAARCASRERAPGRGTPWLISSAMITRAHSGRVSHAASLDRPASRVCTSRACQNSLDPPARPGAARARPDRPRGRAAAITPSTAASGAATRSSGQQAGGVQPAGVGQLGQRRGQGQPGPEADRGLQRAGHHHRQPDPLGDLQAGPDAAQRLHLEHRDVGRLQRRPPDTGPRPGGSTRRPRSARRSRSGPAGGAARPVPRPCGRAARRTPARTGAAPAIAACGLVQRPGPVGVDPDPAVGPERVPHGLDPGQVVGQRSAGLGDLDLGRPAAGRPGPGRTPAPARPPGWCC